MLWCLVLSSTAWSWTAHAQNTATEPSNVAALEGAESLALDAVQTLDQVALTLAQAQEEAAALREIDALRQLARARALVERVLMLPGASRWLAEVELRTAVVAAQAGLDGLSEAAMRRAASLDPGRRLRAGEAPPEVVARAARGYDAMRLAPEGTFAVELLRMPGGDAPIARVFVDDQPLGALPRVVNARVGRHVLRAEALGCTAYATLIEVFEGHRPTLTIALAPLHSVPTPAQTALASSPPPLPHTGAQSSALPPPASTPIWRHWYLWSGAAVVVAATTLALVLAGQPEPESQLNVRLQTDDVR